MTRKYKPYTFMGEGGRMDDSAKWLILVEGWKEGRKEAVYREESKQNTRMTTLVSKKLRKNGCGCRK